MPEPPCSAHTRADPYADATHGDPYTWPAYLYAAPAMPDRDAYADRNGYPYGDGYAHSHCDAHGDCNAASDANASYRAR